MQETNSLKHKMFGGWVGPQTPALIFEILYLTISQGREVCTLHLRHEAKHSYSQ